MSEPTFNQNPYFTNEQLEFISKEYRTIPVDGEGQSYEPKYNSMQVRSDVLKLISDVRQARRQQYEDENSSIEMLTKQITDEVAISAAAIVERDRLHDENQSLRRSLTSEAVKDANYNVEIVRLHKELEEAQQAMSEPHKNLWFKWTNERNRSEEARMEAIYLARKLEEERKQSAAVRKAMQDVLYYLQRDSLIPARDILEQYLAMSVGQEGEGNQDESQDGCPET